MSINLRFIRETLRDVILQIHASPFPSDKIPRLFVIYVPTNNQICDNLLLTGKRGKAKFEDTGAENRANRPTRDRHERKREIVESAPAAIKLINRPTSGKHGPRVWSSLRHPRSFVQRRRNFPRPSSLPLSRRQWWRNKVTGAEKRTM